MTARRIIVVSYFHPPFSGAGGVRWLSMARHLRRLGHSVTIVATDAFGRLPDDDANGVIRIHDLRSTRAFRRLLRRGDVTVPGSSTPEAPPTFLLTRVFVPDAQVVSWVPGALAAVRRLIAREEVDCLITTSPPESVHLIGLALRGRRPAWVADFRDGWSFEPLREPFATASQRRLDGWLEHRVARAADATVGAYAAVADDLAQRLHARTRYISNGWDPLISGGQCAGSETDDMPVRGGRAFTFVYTGTLSGVRGLDPAPFFDALRAALETPGVPNARLLIAGRLTNDEQAIIDRSGVGHVVEHLGMLSHRDAVSLQRSADALVLLTAPHASAATAKVFEYLATGKPVIALADASEAADIIRNANAGIVVPPEDVAAITEALVSALRGDLRVGSRSHGIDEYAYPRPAEAMEEVIEAAIESRGRTRK